MSKIKKRYQTRSQEIIYTMIRLRESTRIINKSKEQKQKRVLPWEQTHCLLCSVQYPHITTSQLLTAIVRGHLVGLSSDSQHKPQPQSSVKWNIHKSNPSTEHGMPASLSNHARAPYSETHLIQSQCSSLITANCCWRAHSFTCWKPTNLNIHAVR